MKGATARAFIRTSREAKAATGDSESRTRPEAPIEVGAFASAAVHYSTAGIRQPDFTSRNLNPITVGSAGEECVAIGAVSECSTA